MWFQQTPTNQFIPACFQQALLAGLVIAVMALTWGGIHPSAAVAAVDPYVARYLDAASPVPLAYDETGAVREFTGADLSEGKRLFEDSCINCHVGGATLPDPTISLSLDALRGATPPRNNIQNLVAFQRLPMTYDGSQESYWCRQVPETWMNQEEIEKLAAFVLRAAQKAPGWGTNEF
ncbi:MAG: photosystem II cytochrome PsbV2 [Synechococcales bacterium]|nr:photosystem II cytochrome PsbV2 [Synechococcales bacterium]